jgi:mono/diheme cytochrome c family protein
MSRTILRPVSLLLVFCLSAVSSAAKPTAAQLEFFEKKIRPVLVAKCHGCHSVKAKAVKGGLLLDSRGGWAKGGESGPAVIPGNPAESPLIQAIRYDGLEMPPKEKLSEQQIADFTRWVKMGAPDPRTGQTASLIRREINIEESRKFWAYRPPVAAPLPVVEQREWPVDPIDRFILARIESAKLAPVGDADRTMLVRRIFFDLVGLPPTPEQVDSFLNDNSAKALESLVDRLLASPHFGERWGRHWLDVARFAESTGMERNYTFPQAWRYRDYVIDAFNRDLPFDRFITEQIAGDLLPAKTPADRNRLIIATGFLALGPKSLNERNKEIFRMNIVDEQIDITTRAVLGLTVSCARCHDHKFDPFPTEDYYALAGIFRSTSTLFGTSKGQGNRQPSSLVSLKATGTAAKAKPKPADTPKAAKPKAAGAKQIAKLTRQLREARAELKKAIAALPGKGKKKKRNNKTLRPIRTRIKQLNQKLKRANAGKGGLANAKPTGPAAMGVRDAAPADCKVHLRGNVRTLGKTVPRGFLQVVHLDSAPTVDAKQSGRLQLARWMVHSDNPLTARVMANRIWYHLTGRGLVSTVDNFGLMGQRPSHPELLDHLALRFVENGWSVKQLVRDIVLSHTYRLSSSPSAAANAKDPLNTLFWRMNHRRLDAESLRDAILSASGQLDATPRKRSAVAEVGNINVGRTNRNVSNRLDAASRHRSVYLPILRNRLPEMLRLFDFAEPSIIVGRRSVTTVPSQALFLLNSPFILEQSDRMAERVLAVSGNAGDRVRRAYRLALARRPSEAESRAATSLIQDTLAGLPEGNAEKNRKQAWSALCQSLLACAEFRYQP